MQQIFYEMALKTKGQGFYDFTSNTLDWLNKQKIKNGILNINILHTSASLVIQENADPDVLHDLKIFFDKLVPMDNKLYKHTALQSSFGIIMLAIVAGRPQVMSLLELVEHFLAFRRDIVRRRTEHELRKAEARAHILEGLRVALDHLDAVIKLIRSAKSPAEARGGLIDQFELTQKQAQAILDMQLQRLTGLERQKIIDELAELIKTIDRLRAILESETLIRDIVVRELREIQEKYGDDRRTEIIEAAGEFRVEDLIAKEDMAITVSKKGYIKRTAMKEYRQQGRGGKGRIGMRTREEDLLTQVFVASTHDYILIFSDRGRVYWLKVHEIPDVGPAAQGKSVANLVAMAPKDLKLRIWMPWQKREFDLQIFMCLKPYAAQVGLR